MDKSCGASNMELFTFIACDLVYNVSRQAYVGMWDGKVGSGASVLCSVVRLKARLSVQDLWAIRTGRRSLQKILVILWSSHSVMNGILMYGRSVLGI